MVCLLQDVQLSELSNLQDPFNFDTARKCPDNKSFYRNSRPERPSCVYLENNQIPPPRDSHYDALNRQFQNELELKHHFNSLFNTKQRDFEPLSFESLGFEPHDFEPHSFDSLEARRFKPDDSRESQRFEAPESQRFEVNESQKFKQHDSQKFQPNDSQQLESQKSRNFEPVEFKSHNFEVCNFNPNNCGTHQFEYSHDSQPHNFEQQNCYTYNLNDLSSNDKRNFLEEIPIKKCSPLSSESENTHYNYPYDHNEHSGEECEYKTAHYENSSRKDFSDNFEPDLLNGFENSDDFEALNNLKNSLNSESKQLDESERWYALDEKEEGSLKKNEPPRRFLNDGSWVTFNHA